MGVLLAACGLALGLWGAAAVYRVQVARGSAALRGDFVGPDGEASRRKTVERIGRAR